MPATKHNIASKSIKLGNSFSYKTQTNMEAHNTLSAWRTVSLIPWSTKAISVI